MIDYPTFGGAPGNMRVEHPGLLLDRYASYSNQTFEKFDQGEDHKRLLQEVVETSKCGLSNDDQRMILSRWDFIMTLPHCETFEASTIWRLASHLARASTVENASISLHPLYGFAYLPGEGLKGLALAWAKTLGTHNGAVDEADVLRIFGTPDAAGTVVFFDAWPITWPCLSVDIVNNHHRLYYDGLGDAGDWEAPNPTYFLTVPPTTCFRFAVALRDSLSTDLKDVNLAVAWLMGGLRDLGAGAKTAAGYGYFKVPQ